MFSLSRGSDSNYDCIIMVFVFNFHPFVDVSFAKAFSNVDVRINFFHPKVNVLSSSSDFGIMLTSSTASSSVNSHSLIKSFTNILAHLD